MKIPKSHPRYISLKTRELIVQGVKKGITSPDGLIAHGRGEAFDYLLKEKTHDFAKKSIKAAAIMLIKAKKPIISVNGNVAALVPKELVKISNLIPAELEVNIFHSSKKREILIKKHLINHGAKKVLMPQIKHLKNIESNRSYVNKEGIKKADVILVPLEDGDRCEALRKAGKKVITIDLNPLSRTAKKANITIVDNIIRAMPLFIKEIKYLKKKKNIKKVKYSNKIILKQALNNIS